MFFYRFKKHRSIWICVLTLLWFFNEIEESYNEKTKHMFKNDNVWRVSLAKFLGFSLGLQNEYGIQGSARKKAYAFYEYSLSSCTRK